MQVRGPVLLVTAHPDDECMFFSPIILSLKQRAIPVDLLCLSAGNFYGVGRERCKELKNAAKTLGIRHVRRVTDEKLPDHPRKIWPTDRIQKYVLQSVNKWHSKTIVSFDRLGVSGHSNHCQIHSALAETIFKGNAAVYSLKTYNIVAKYLALLAFFLAFFSSKRFLFSIPITSPLLPHRAMLQHRSQLIWFRYLYILFSAYMYINVFIPLKH
ncbi:hypothetical protein Aperf_G00000095928 [Anoplocephala perfoliata]